MDKKKLGYVRRGKNKRKTTSSNNQLMSKSQLVRKKGRSQGQNLENIDSHISPASVVSPQDQEPSPTTCQEAYEESNIHGQEDSP